jgi:hypothetical protein
MLFSLGTAFSQQYLISDNHTQITSPQTEFVQSNRSQILKKINEHGKNSPVITVNGKSVLNKKQLAYIMETKFESIDNEALNTLVDDLITKEILFEEAVANNLLVSLEDAKAYRDYVRKEVQAFHISYPNMKFFHEFYLEAFDLTEEEFWENSIILYQKDLTIEKLFEEQSENEITKNVNERKKLVNISIDDQVIAR